MVVGYVIDLVGLDACTFDVSTRPHYNCLIRLARDIVCNLNATAAFTYFTSPTDKITMSFGFSVGDFLAFYQLASQIRKDFFNAPSEFKAISDE